MPPSSRLGILFNVAFVTLPDFHTHGKIHTSNKHPALGSSLSRPGAKSKETQMIRKGMTITLKPEYMDPGDENLTFIVLTDEKKSRLDV
jgi:hypothetical protein